MTVYSITDPDTFALAATIKGYLPPTDEDEYLDHMVFRLRSWHALDRGDLHAHAAEYLDRFGRESEDEMIYELVAEWSNELNKACLISFNGPGRRKRAEIEWIRFQLYCLTADEYPATVRGIYYRALAAGWIPKGDSAYNMVQGQLLTMRRQGLLPWDWITDSSRLVRGRKRFKGLEEYAKWVQSNYRADYWANHEVNVEVWCEKEALVGVLFSTVVDEFGLDLHISKGQSSASYVYEAAKQVEGDGRPTHIYILSDFDPGGFRVADKVETEMREHLGEDYDLTVERIAATPEQIESWDLPTREVKKGDKQAAAFIRRYGDISCELDAIAPSQLRALVREHLESHMDQRQLRTLKLVEEEEREGLKQIEDMFGGAA